MGRFTLKFNLLVEMLKEWKIYIQILWRKLKYYTGIFLKYFTFQQDISEVRWWFDRHVLLTLYHYGGLNVWLLHTAQPVSRIVVVKLLMNWQKWPKSIWEIAEMILGLRVFSLRLSHKSEYTSSFEVQTLLLWYNTRRADFDCSRLLIRDKVDQNSCTQECCKREKKASAIASC